MEPHIQGDTVHTREEVASAEKQLNGAATKILGAFKFGEDWGHEARMKLVKVHKEILLNRPVGWAQVRQATNGPLYSL